MVLLVPYDGSPVSKAALERAVEHGEALDSDVVAVSFVPTGSEYALRRTWIEPSDDFATDVAREELERKIEETVDDAQRNFEDAGASAPADGAANHIRQVAEDVGASTLYVGTSEEAENEPMTPFGPVAPDGAYDVHLVRSG
jgi:nucleotide-binding universal stress UspA family protein